MKVAKQYFQFRTPRVSLLVPHLKLCRCCRQGGHGNRGVGRSKIQSCKNRVQLQFPPCGFQCENESLDTSTPTVQLMRFRLGFLWCIHGHFQRTIWGENGFQNSPRLKSHQFAEFATPRFVTWFWGPKEQSTVSNFRPPPGGALAELSAEQSANPNYL